MTEYIYAMAPLIGGWCADLALGDPSSLPHPIVWFGKAIAWGEHHLNHGSHRRLKGALMAVLLILTVFALTWALCYYLALWCWQVSVVVQALNPEAQLLPQNPIPDQIHKTLTPGFMPGL